MRDRFLPALFYSLFLLAGALLAAGCDTVDPGADTAEVAVKFGIASPAPTARAAKAFADELVVSGSNGTLVLTDIRLLIESLELERDDDACEAVAGEDRRDDDCEEFETEPFMVDLPLTGEPVTVATEAVPAGVYTGLELETSDLDVDDEDEVRDFRALEAAVRSVYPDWPEEASMVVTGTFTPTGGEARPFTVFFDAEVEVEMEFATPLQLMDGETGEAFTIALLPEAWFVSRDGTVWDLSQEDYDLGRDLVEFELELEDGFTELRIENDDDEDDEEDDD